MLSTFLPASGGTARIDGYDIHVDIMDVRRRIGYLPENVPLYGDMRVREYLRYRGKLRGITGKKLRARISDVVDLYGLGDVRKQIISSLSRGFRQRVGLADALLHEPEVLILDEPTIGLDPNQIRSVRSLIRSLSGRHTIILSSHILSEVEAVCDKVLILKDGKVAASGSTSELQLMMKGGVQYLLEARAPFDPLCRLLKQIKGVVSVKGTSDGDVCKIVCECEAGTDIREDVFLMIAEKHWKLRELSSRGLRLEEIFSSFTSQDRPAPGTEGDE
jgi:ABC-2 type transport system ATP-binding protein